MSNLIIREGRRTDRSSIESLLRVICFEFGWNFDGEFGLPESDPCYYELKGGKMYVATLRNEVVGCIAFQKKKRLAILLRFYVLPGFRNLGIGKRLMDFLLHELRLRSVSIVFFGTERENLKYLLPIISNFGFERINTPPVSFPNEECSIYYSLEVDSVKLNPHQRLRRWSNQNQSEFA